MREQDQNKRNSVSCATQSGMLDFKTCQSDGSEFGEKERGKCEAVSHGNSGSSEKKFSYITRRLAFVPIAKRRNLQDLSYI